MCDTGDCVGCRYVSHAGYVPSAVSPVRVSGSGPKEPAKKLELEQDWKTERHDILGRFAEELAKATGDGSKKRQAGEKPPWYEDGSHEGAIFSHLTKWKRGELVDPDSGAHPLVHVAWRALAIACQETGNIPSSEKTPS